MKQWHWFCEERTVFVSVRFPVFNWLWIMPASSLHRFYHLHLLQQSQQTSPAHKNGSMGVSPPDRFLAFNKPPALWHTVHNYTKPFHSAWAWQVLPIPWDVVSKDESRVIVVFMYAKLCLYKRHYTVCLIKLKAPQLKTCMTSSPCSLWLAAGLITEIGLLRSDQNHCAMYDLGVYMTDQL